MIRQVHVGTTIDPDHPLVELLGGLKPVRMLLRSLGDATQRGLAHKDPDLAEAVRVLVDVVRRETRVEFEKASGLPINPESNALVLRLRARLGALETVERALRASTTKPLGRNEEDGDVQSGSDAWPTGPDEIAG